MTDGERSAKKKLKIPTKIFNSSFMESIFKSKKKSYHKMNLEGIVESFVRTSVSHKDISSFLNDSNYSIFSKTAKNNVTPQKSAIDLIAQQHKTLQAKIKNRAGPRDKKSICPPPKTSVNRVKGVKKYESKKSQETLPSEHKMGGNFIHRDIKKGMFLNEVSFSFGIDYLV